MLQRAALNQAGLPCRDGDVWRRGATRSLILALYSYVLVWLTPVNDSRLKTWVRRLYGVSTYYLENHLDWLRALDRMPHGPARHAQLLALALGR